MDCADAKLRMEPCASGALVPEELALFEEHIASCEGCRLELELVRAMGATGKPEEPKSDDWTLDRIFGAEAGKAPAPAASSEPAPSPAPEPPSASAPAPEGASEPEHLALDSLAAGLDAPQASAPAPEPSEAAMIFESTPNPMPPEASPSPAPTPASEPAFEGAATSADVSAAMAAIAPKPERTARAKTDKSDGPDESWDFEPADAKPEAALPEGSLFFAEETLARQGKARKGQSSAKRMMIWGAGAVVGLGLLALSLWIGFFARQGESDSTAPLAGTGTSGTADGSPSDSTAATSDGSAEVAPPVQTPEVLTQPADEVVAQPPAPLGARALSGTGVPPLPGPSKSTSASVAPRSTTGAPAPKSQQGASSGPASAAPKQGTPKSATGTTPRQPAPADTVDPEQALLRAPAPYQEQDIPFSSPKIGDGKGTTTTKTPAPSGTAPPVSKPVAPEPDPAPPVDAVQRPIDRLHLATVAAEQADDLVTLRKLRDTWKGLVRTSVGPDRARAKRELADCYWAIQTLTGRNSDKKDALAAYREYLLNAPAGGADPRTVARMRQLEDALAESK